MNGIPDVRIDGKYREAGGGNGCGDEIERYSGDYELRMEETGGTSPVRIEGTFQVQAHTAQLSATFTLEDPQPQGALHGTLFLYQDEIQWCCGYGNVAQWSQILRYVDSEPVILNNQGDQHVMTRQVPLSVGWSPNDLHAVAVIERATAPLTIIQAGRIDIPDFVMTFPRKIGSVVRGSGSGIFDGTLRSTADRPDVLTLSVDSGFGWPTDFQIAGDPDWYTSQQVPVAPGDSLQVRVRVRTDGVKRIGSGAFTAVSANTGRDHSVPLRLFNASYAILLVDDDDNTSINGYPAQTPFVHALDSLGYLYDNWDVVNGHVNASPQATDMYGLDVVIWETGYEVGPLTSFDVYNLKGYLNAGGGLYLNSMEFLTDQPGPGDFTTNYLGLAWWTNNTKCHTASGVEGDPITSGMSLPLYFQNENVNHVDGLVPAAGAFAIFYSEQTPPRANAVRFESERYRTVFSTIPQNAISEIDAPPNNNQTLIEGIVQWLGPRGVSAVEAPPRDDDGSSLSVSPNPSVGRAGIAFTLSGDDGEALLCIFDPAGRLVRRLAQGRFAAGTHRVVWDGKDDGGRPASSGGYFARLDAGGTRAWRKIVILQFGR